MAVYLLINSRAIFDISEWLPHLELYPGTVRDIVGQQSSEREIWLSRAYSTRSFTPQQWRHDTGHINTSMASQLPSECFMSVLWLRYSLERPWTFFHIFLRLTFYLEPLLCNLWLYLMAFLPFACVLVLFFKRCRPLDGTSKHGNYHMWFHNIERS